MLKFIDTNETGEMCCLCETAQNHKAPLIVLRALVLLCASSTTLRGKETLAGIAKEREKKAPDKFSAAHASCICFRSNK